MDKIFAACFGFLFCFQSLFADNITMVGYDVEGRAVYWTAVPPDAPSSSQVLDKGVYDEAAAYAVAYAPNTTAYIGGNALNDEFSTVAYWTLPLGSSASNLQILGGPTDSGQVEIYGIAFNPSGIGYMVGTSDSGTPAYWTIALNGTVSPSVDLDTDGYAQAVAFFTDGKGYIVGADSSFNICYWNISSGGVIDGPHILLGGETGGAASGYDVAVAPNGTAYIAGANTSGVACYWTVSSLGVASSAIELGGTSINSQGRGIAFLPTGEGIIVGQASGNVACYWTISAEGVVGDAQALPNGFGSSSSAYDVAFGSDGAAYIVGADQFSQAALWTLPTVTGSANYQILESGGVGLCNSIAIYFLLNPEPPSDLTGIKIINDFGWVYEYAARLSWSPSPSPGVVSYHIYKDEVLIGTTDSSTTTYLDHNVKKSNYAVTAVDGVGRESTPVTLYIK